MQECEHLGARSPRRIFHAPAGSRSRKVLTAAPDVVEDVDVLELLLAPAVEDGRILARQLVSTFGGLGAVLGANVEHLAACLGWEAAHQLRLVHVALHRVLRERIKDRPLIGSWDALEDYLLATLRHETIEQLRILFLDRKNGLILDEIMQLGTVDHVPTYPREIAKRALELDASAVIMAHNHPSGDPSPSRADIEMTKQVMAALSPLGIALHDHAVVGRNEVSSLRARRLI